MNFKDTTKCLLGSATGLTSQEFHLGITLPTIWLQSRQETAVWKPNSHKLLMMSLGLPAFILLLSMRSKGAPPQTRTEALAALKQWAPQDSNYLPIGDDAEDAYTLTLVQGRVNERYAYFPVWPGYVLSLQEQIEAIFREVGDEERPPDDEERLQGVLSKIYYRVFFTEKGRPLWNGTGGNQASRHHRHHSRLRRTHRPAPLAFHPPPPSHQTLYIHGFWEGESLLGRMPAPLTLRFVKDRTGIVVSRFFNSAMGAETHEVPSLQSLPLPQGWQQLVDVERKLSDLLTVTWFGNESTGEKMNSDPRMRGAKLRERAVKVESFALL